MRRLRWYPDLRIVAVCPCLPPACAAVTFGRLPAYSGATVPALDRLPSRKREWSGYHVQAAVPRSLKLASVYGKVRGAVFSAIAAAALSACGYSPPGAPVSNAKRIVTLMPVFADDLCAMGDGARIVGVSRYTRSAVCAAHVPEVADFASVDSEKIIALHPDAVLAIPAQSRLTASLERAGIRTIFLRDDSYRDIFAGIGELGRITGDARAARRLELRLRRRTAQIVNAHRFARHPSVFVVLQAQPIWTVGPQSYISTLLAMAGARNAVTRLPRAYAQYSAEALIRLQPDAIVAGSDTQLTSLLDREPWRSLRAVQRKQVYILPDPAVLERPGPDYNEGLSWLIEHLRPLST